MDSRPPYRRRRMLALACLLAGVLIAASVGFAVGRADQDRDEAAPTRMATPVEEGPEVVPPSPGPSQPKQPARPPRPRFQPVDYRNSRAVGAHEAGTLERGVLLPPEGRTWVSWDPVEREKPNRYWRRWGTDELVRATLNVVREFAADHPNAERILIGDLSRTRGGDFGTDYGPIGHASHQNGLDVDVYYPRLDGREWTPRLPSQVDVKLSQDLVDRFVAAGAERVFVGPSLPLTGPAEVVVPLVNHDNHLHFRLPLAG